MFGNIMSKTSSALGIAFYKIGVATAVIGTSPLWLTVDAVNLAGSLVRAGNGETMPADEWWGLPGSARIIFKPVAQVSAAVINKDSGKVEVAATFIWRVSQDLRVDRCFITEKDYSVEELQLLVVALKKEYKELSRADRRANYTEHFNLTAEKLDSMVTVKPKATKKSKAKKQPEPKKVTPKTEEPIEEETASDVEYTDQEMPIDFTNREYIEQEMIRLGGEEFLAFSKKFLPKGGFVATFMSGVGTVTVDAHIAEKMGFNVGVFTWVEENDCRELFTWLSGTREEAVGGIFKGLKMKPMAALHEILTGEKIAWSGGAIKKIDLANKTYDAFFGIKQKEEAAA